MPATVTPTEVQYLTKEGDMLDLICWNYYGRTQQVVEAVLQVNRALLANYPATLPAGLIMVLPVVNVPIAGSIKLWNYRPARFYPKPEPYPKETLADVLSALDAYRSARADTVTSSPAPPPTVIWVGNRLRIREEGDRTVVERLNDKGFWVKQQEWT